MLYLPPARLAIEPLLVEIARVKVLAPLLHQLLHLLVPLLPRFLHFRSESGLLLGGNLLSSEVLEPTKHICSVEGRPLT